jgi:hypothetical protein
MRVKSLLTVAQLALQPSFPDRKISSNDLVVILVLEDQLPHFEQSRD